MLKSEYRLKKKYQFNYVYRVGKSVHGKFLLLIYSKSKNKNVKIGISVSKKVGGAVVRNRTRRLLREAVKPELCNLKPDFNIIIVAKQAILNKKLSEIAADFQNTLKRTELLK